jgi:AraC-like DNA-binding protein/mannose-6-phosphate isomerase-like protein (cupin superfamily)
MAKTTQSPYRREFDAPATLVAGVRTFGYDRFVRAQYGQLGEHAHPGCYEICYLVGGSVERWNEDGLIEVHPGDVYFTRPGELHGGRDTVMHSCELYWLILKLPPEFATTFDRMRRRAFRGNDTIAECFRTIRDELISPGIHAEALIRSLIDRLLIECTRAYQHDSAAADKPSVTPPIRKAMDWMQQHLTAELSVQDAAEIAALSTSRFHERFAAETGFSPLEYHTRLHLHRARQLLADTDQPITRIAFDLGFSSSQYFATVFKNHVGLTPGEFRARHAADQA